MEEGLILRHENLFIEITLSQDLTGYVDFSCKLGVIKECVM